MIDLSTLVNVKFYDYRQIIVNGLIKIDGPEAVRFVNELCRMSNGVFDNHIAFKLTKTDGTELYVQWSDNHIIVGPSFKRGIY